jgi:putative NIF3 family GTP cyclohydrolase 1 type 2
MTHLNDVVLSLDRFFAVRDLAQDPAMSRILPPVYDAIGFDWRNAFEPDFASRFNGLMLRGADDIQAVYLASFPSADVLRVFLDQAQPGDLFFTHHPVDIRNGDPRGEWGAGFTPIDPALIATFKQRKLSLYAVHAPLDTNERISTSKAMADALGGVIVDHFCQYGLGYAGVIARIPSLSLDTLVEHALKTYGIEYLDIAGPRRDVSGIEQVGIVAGVGDHVEWMQEAEAKGAQAYLTGEIHVRIEGDYGRSKYARVREFAGATAMPLIGVSHAASEYLVMQRDMGPWFEREFRLRTKLLPEAHWWR